MITPWSLPPNLPNTVVEEVVKKLEEELRGVLAKVILKRRLEDQTCRKSSGSSSDVSVDSHPFTQDDEPERVSFLVDEPQNTSKYVPHRTLEDIGDVE
jgi:hypothetical protein